MVDMGIIPDIDPGHFEGRNKFHVCKVGRGAGNIAKGPAMSRHQAEQSVLQGFRLASELFSAGVRLLGNR